MAENRDAITPSHYVDHVVSPIDLIEAYGMGEAFCIGNVIKYVARYNEKNGTEDLKKARWYLERVIQAREALK